MKKKRYWGLAVFAVIWVFAVIIMNAADGRHGVGFVTVLWLIVAYYAIKGNIKAIISTAKVAIAIQVVVGVGFTLWLANDRGAQNLLGDPIIFAISIGIPTLAWVVLFFWAKPKSEQIQFDESVETTEPDAAKNLPEENDRKTVDKAAVSESAWKYALGATVLALLIALPLITQATGQSAMLTLASRILIYGIAAASLNLVLGYGGMVSFGHAAFFGVGGYVVGILFHHAASGEPLLGFIPGTTQMLITLPTAMLVSGVVAALIGALALRTGGVQFIMITLAFAQMLFFLFVSLKGYGGEDGIIVRRTNELPFVNTRDRAVLYWVILAVAVVFFIGLWRVVNSSFGAVLVGIRQNERRMQALGIAPFRTKLFAFALSGAGAGLAGALMVNLLRFASPDMMHWTKSGELMIMVILGGVGTLFGPLIGAGVFLTLENFLAGWTEYWALPLGIILLIVVLRGKGGLLGLFRRRE
jgi:branched-chain amino acid transport system permease protein